MTKRVISTAIFLVLAPMVASQTSDDNPTGTSELAARPNQSTEELRLRLEKLKSLQQEEKNQLDLLYALDEELSLTSQIAAKIDREIKALQIETDRLKEQLDSCQHELEVRQKMAADRLIWIYKRSRKQFNYAALFAADLLGAARQFYYLKVLNQFDRRAIQRLAELTATADSTRHALAQKQSDIRRLAADKQKQISALLVARQRKEAIVRSLRSRREIERQYLQNLLQSQQEISSMMDQLTSIDTTGHETLVAESFAVLQGKLPWPVAGKVIRPFGRIKDRRFGTFLTNPGIDIEAPAGAKVAAVASGRVAYVSWLKGYGSLVVLNHGFGFFTLYAHLEDVIVEAGQGVTSGQQIGTVGTSVEAKTGLLHFELRQRQNQLDPLQWLR